MTVFNETSELWTARLLLVASVASASSDDGTDLPGALCCWYIPFCCWVLC